jgi:hypothetical protein
MDNKPANIPITPETKVAALLDNYPQLESALMSLAPAFAKLQSPILRKTVARVTTLRQAAKVGGVSLNEMINKLRQAAGISSENFVEESIHEANGKTPDWFKKSAIYKTIDARPILEKGEHPLGLVLNEIRQLQPGQILELVTPFLPAPLIDKGKETGCLVYSMSEKDDLIRTYFVIK